MEIKQVNEILANLENPTATKGVALFTKFDPPERDELGQGESDERMRIYTTPFDGVFLQITEKSDSYQSNWSVKSIQFVQPVQKQVTDYEPIK